MNQSTLDALVRSPFGTVIKEAALAEADKIAAPDRDWWRGEALWRNASSGRAEPTADEAFASIRAQCRITPLQEVGVVELDELYTFIGTKKNGSTS